jgi:hypothetical protein
MRFETGTLLRHCGGIHIQAHGNGAKKITIGCVR